jgi:hypothetical protein
MGKGQRVYILYKNNSMIGIFSNISQVRRIQINYNILELTLKECRINNVIDEISSTLLDKTYLLKQLPTHLEYTIKKEQLKHNLIKQVAEVNDNIGDILKDISIDDVTFIQEQPQRDTQKKSKYQHKNKDKYIKKSTVVNNNDKCLL